MKTSLNDIMAIERHLEGKMNVDEASAFNRKLQADPALRGNVFMQSRLLNLLRIYHRKKVKHQLEQIHLQLLKTGFKNSIQSIFNQ